MSELKNCPFCGELPHLYLEDGLTASRHYIAHVTCGNCDEVSQLVYNRDKNLVEKEAAAKWNTRSPQPAAQGWEDNPHHKFVHVDDLIRLVTEAGEVWEGESQMEVLSTEQEEQIEAAIRNYFIFPPKNGAGGGNAD